MEAVAVREKFWTVTSGVIVTGVRTVITILLIFRVKGL